MKKISYISSLILEGEHQQQDFKFGITDSRKIARSLVAFANTDGGRLLIGQISRLCEDQFWRFQ